MGKKECLLTTYVSGVSYQAFIPLLVYSCNKAYPEYDIMLFLHEELTPDIRKVLLDTGLNQKVTIKENVFRKECPNMTSLQAKSCRWVMWDEAFLEYEYLYIVDIDMFYVREPMPLHQQHAERMTKTGLPFDNMRRKAYVKKSFKELVKRVKTSGIKKLGRYLFTKDICEEKLSGLHFIDVGRFYTESNRQYMEDTKARLFKRFYFPEIMTLNNEVLLANMMKGMGYDISVLGVQTDEVKSLSFTDIFRSEFRPHHGFHLGIFCYDNVDLVNKFNKSTLESDTYKFYLSKYKEIIKEKDYLDMYSHLPAFAKTYLDRLHRYYSISL